MRSVSIVVMKIQKVEFLHKDAHIFAIRTNRGVNEKPFRVENIGLFVGNPRKSSGTNWRQEGGSRRRPGLKRRCYQLLRPLDASRQNLATARNSQVFLRYQIFISKVRKSGKAFGSKLEVERVKIWWKYLSFHLLLSTTSVPRRRIRSLRVIR